MIAMVMGTNRDAASTVKAISTSVSPLSGSEWTSEWIYKQKNMHTHLINQRSVYSLIALHLQLHSAFTLISPLSIVRTEWTSHDPLHPAMLHGMTEMLYTLSGSSEVILNDAPRVSVELTSVINPL